MSAQRARIAARAHELWERRGKPQGSPEIDWYAAEKELLIGDASDPTKPNARLDSLPDVVTIDSDKGPTDSGTKTTDGPERSRTGRTSARQKRENGEARE
jgi:hypothetical protein